MIRFIALVTFFAVLGSWLEAYDASAASLSPALQETKRNAEVKGFVFETSHDEIVTKAKKEGRVKALTGLDPETFPHMIESFKRKYPFIDVELVEIQGPDAAQRFVMELKARTAQKWDTANAATEFYAEYAEFAKKFDVLGMAEHGVLGISTKMIDPKYRNNVSLTSGISVNAYNKNLISEDRV